VIAPGRKERNGIIKGWCQEEHTANGSKQNGQITRCYLTSGNRPLLPQCDKEGVALNGIYFHDVKR